MKFKLTCEKRILSKYNPVDVMFKLNEFALDVFVEGLRFRNPNINEEKIREKLLECAKVWNMLKD